MAYNQSNIKFYQTKDAAINAINPNEETENPPLDISYINRLSKKDQQNVWACIPIAETNKIMVVRYPELKVWLNKKSSIESKKENYYTQNNQTDSNSSKAVILRYTMTLSAFSRQSNPSLELSDMKSGNNYKIYSINRSNLLDSSVSYAHMPRDNKHYANNIIATHKMLNNVKTEINTNSKELDQNEKKAVKQFFDTYEKQHKKFSSRFNNSYWKKLDRTKVSLDDIINHAFKGHKHLDGKFTFTGDNSQTTLMTFLTKEQKQQFKNGNLTKEDLKSAILNKNTAKSDKTVTDLFKFPSSKDDNDSSMAGIDSKDELDIDSNISKDDSNTLEVTH